MRGYLESIRASDALILVYMSSAFYSAFSSLLGKLSEEERDMKFGKRLRAEVRETIPEWRSEFISYKQLKKLINQIDPDLRETSVFSKRPRFATLDSLGAGGRYVHMMSEDVGFIRLFEGEIEKVNAFFVNKEEDYIIKLKELQEMVAKLDDYDDGEILEVQKNILDFHAEMVLLLHYSVLNFTGFMKIAKKHDKKIVRKQNMWAPSHIYFMPRVLQQPFFSTDLLYKLMKDCEAMLDHLFTANNPPDHPDDHL